MDALTLQDLGANVHPNVAGSFKMASTSRLRGTT